MWCWKYNSDRHKIGNWITHYSVYPSQLVKPFFILDSDSIGMIDHGNTISYLHFCITYTYDSHISYESYDVRPREKFVLQTYFVKIHCKPHMTETLYRNWTKYIQRKNFSRYLTSYESYRMTHMQTFSKIDTFEFIVIIFIVNIVKRRNKMTYVIHFWFEVPINWQIRTDFGSNLSAKLRTKNLSRGSFCFVVSLFCHIQKCQCSKTIAYEATCTLIRFCYCVLTVTNADSEQIFRDRSRTWSNIHFKKVRHKLIHR